MIDPSRLRPIKLPKRMPRDPVSHKIAILYALHEDKLEPMPWTTKQLDQMSLHTRNTILVDVKEKLGIREPRSRRLERVLDDIDVEEPGVLAGPPGRETGKPWLMSDLMEFLRIFF